MNAPSRAVRRLEGVKVLVVDDELDTREVLEIMLEQQGADVRSCASAREGIALLEGFAPRVLVSDVGMPDEDGCQFLARVRATSGVPALALTGYARVEDIRKVYQAGFQLHLAKPVGRDELVDAIARLAFTTESCRPAPDL